MAMHSMAQCPITGKAVLVLHPDRICSLSLSLSLSLSHTHTHTLIRPQTNFRRLLCLGLDGLPSKPPMKEWITLAFVLSKAAGATIGEGLSLAFVSQRGKALDIPEGGVVVLVPLANPEVYGH